ncbi:MAG TPA: hypothetical protein VN513_06405 [Gemmatimonadales bacterium]|nr:hypothetical protein [Gemmatimonadales bacterium]
MTDQKDETLRRIRAEWEEEEKAADRLDYDEIGGATYLTVNRPSLLRLQARSYEAGYQAGIEAMRERIDDIVQAICELPDRTSPDDDPGALIVTVQELRRVLDDRLDALKAVDRG